MAFKTKATLLLDVQICGNHTAKQIKDDLYKFLEAKNGTGVISCEVQNLSITNLGVIKKKDPVIHESMMVVRGIIKAAFGDTIKVKQESAGGSIYVNLLIGNINNNWYANIINLVYEPSDQTLNYTTNLHSPDAVEIKLADPQCIKKVYQLVWKHAVDKLNEYNARGNVPSDVIDGLKKILEVKEPT